LHQYLLAKTDFYNRPNDTTTYDITCRALPDNKALQSICEGLSKAHQLYGVPNSIIVMVIQPGERNAMDQRWLEYELLEK
jgi:glutathione synthase